MFCEKILDSLVFCGRLIKVAFFVGQILNPRIAFILGRREYRFHLKSKCLKPKVLGGVNRKIFLLPSSGAFADCDPWLVRELVSPDINCIPVWMDHSHAGRTCCIPCSSLRVCAHWPNGGPACVNCNACGSKAAASTQQQKEHESHVQF
jgi:hypothetical protein